LDEIERDLIQLEKIVKESGIFQELQKGFNFHDEPRFSHYQGKCLCCSYSWSAALSRNDKLARLRALGEMIERHCLTSLLDKTIQGCYDELKKKYSCTNPFDWRSYSDNQMNDPAFSQFIFTNMTNFEWIWAHEIFTEKKILIPKQLVQLALPVGEPIIRWPVSTGAAGGFTIESSIVRGILECVERDAIMISYLKKLPLRTINVDSCPSSVLSLAIYLERYRLQPIILDATLDIKIPIVICILIDRAPHPICNVSLGFNCSTSREKAIIKAIEEAVQVRFLIKQKILNGEKVKKIRTFVDHGLYWGAKKNAKESLAFFLTGPQIEYSELPPDIVFSNYKEGLKQVRQILSNVDLNGIYFTIPFPNSRVQHYYVTKVLIPKLHPLYPDERFPALGGTRIKLFSQKGESLFNPIPHPFT
jgi:ribosomal protein S12 methylthiotransferase accessory factor